MKALSPANMHLPHHKPATAEPIAVSIAEGRVPKTVGMPLEVLVVQKLQCHAPHDVARDESMCSRAPAAPLRRRHSGTAAPPAARRRAPARLPHVSFASVARVSARLTAPTLTPTDALIERYDRPSSHFWRTISLQLRIDSLSVGMRSGVHPSALCHHDCLRFAQRTATTRKGGVHDTDPRVHHADPGVHDAPILAFTMVRSARSRSHEIRTQARHDLKNMPLGALGDEEPGSAGGMTKTAGVMIGLELDLVSKALPERDRLSPIVGSRAGDPRFRASSSLLLSSLLLLCEMLAQRGGHDRRERLLRLHRVVLHLANEIDGEIDVELPQPRTLLGC